MSTIKTNTIQPTLAGNNLIFANGSAAEKMRITNEGLVGIGTTTPSQKLSVEGGLIRVDNLGTSPQTTLILAAQGSNLQVTHDGSPICGFLNSGTGYGGFEFKGNLGTTLHMDGTGKVGIGTVSPASPLHIRGTPDQLLLLEGIGSTSYMRFRSNSLNRGYIGHFDTAQKGMYLINQRAASELDSSLYLGTNDGVRLTITGDGNVGIGTTSPTVALDVLGAGKFSQSVTIGGAAFAAPSGTAPIFGARALVVFDTNRTAAGTTETTLTATNRFIRHGGNIASVNRTAVGIYIITFTTPMPHADYVVICSTANNLQNSSLVASLSAGTTTTANTYAVATPPLQPFNKTTTSFTIHTGSSASGNRFDPVSNPISVLVFA